jgi:hypothetical protein
MAESALESNTISFQEPGNLLTVSNFPGKPAPELRGRENPGVTFHISAVCPWTVTRFLFLIVGILVLASTLGQLMAHHCGDIYMKGFVPLFYLDGEANIPTWYSAFALLAAAGLLALIALHRRVCGDQSSVYWASMTAMLGFLSLDEVSQIHEYPVEPMREAIDGTGYLHYAWVIPAAVLTTTVAALLWRFVMDLPRRTRYLFTLAGATFVGGALGVEMISGNHIYHHGDRDLGYVLIITIEEWMEMLGVVIFIHALLDYMRIINLSFEYGSPAAIPRSD